MQELKKTLNYSILDGAFHAMMVALGEAFFISCAIFLGASTFEVGILASVPPLLGAYIQIFSSPLLGLFGTRKCMVSTFALLQSIAFIPLAGLLYLDQLSVNALIIITFIYSMACLVFYPVWRNWMGDLVDEYQRGGYFGKRNRIVSLANLVAMVGAALVFQQYQSQGTVDSSAFLLLFSLAGICRLISFFFLRKKTEPPVKPLEVRAGFRHFLGEILSTNYGHLTIFQSLVSFAVFLSLPYFSLYMLRDLQLAYWQIATVHAVAIATRVLSMPGWGAAIDRFGSRKVLKMSAVIMPLAPVLWVFNSSIVYIYFIQIFAGFIWAGYDLAIFSYSLDATSPERRTKYISYFNIINGSMIFLGGMTGAFLIKFNFQNCSPIFFVFVLSGSMRIIISIFFFIPGWFAEVREVENIKYRHLLLRIIGNVPMKGLMLDYRLARSSGREKR